MNSEKPLHVAVGVIKNARDEILISHRDQSAHQGGLWEFPGGKVEFGETAEQALGRELKEELNIDINKISPLIHINYRYPDIAVHLDVWAVDGYSGPVTAREGQPIKWTSLQELGNYQFPAANQPIIAATQLPQRYAIVNGDAVEYLCHQLRQIVARGERLIQLRAKSLSGRELEQLLAYAQPLCQSQQVQLILNSGMVDVLQYAVEGVHLTSRDLMSMQHRPRGIRWLAASCHNIEELRYAERLGVDFAVLAPVQPTKTHVGATCLGWERFAQMVSRVNIPVFALGGMTLFDEATARRMGGQGVCGIGMFLDSLGSEINED